MRKNKNLICLVLIYTFCCGLFAPFASAQSRTGLQFQLREAESKTEKREVSAPPVAADLSRAETDAILRRLPPMPTEENYGQTNFALRSKTFPPPRTGSVIPIKFPADEQSDPPNFNANNSAPLEVVRFSPEGKNPLVSDLSITFSQPMIAVTSQTEASETVPVQLTPNVKGKWRWLGAKTLILDAESRFPMATKYTATIPAGTKSATGGSLAKEISWNFETPPPKVERFAAKGSEPSEPGSDAIMTASFNQEINEEAILPKIILTANGRRFPVRSVTKEVNGSYTVVQALGEIKPKHWLAFRAAEPLPLDSEIKVTFEKGLPSAEGELTSEAAQEFKFKTYGPLKFVKSHCGYYDYQNKKQCEPSEVFRLEFNNLLYPVALESGQVKIEPGLPDAKVFVSHNAVIVEGKKAARTTYKVTVSPALKDWYKQTLGAEISATFDVGSERSLFFAQGGNFVTLDPQAKRKFSVYSRNQPSLRVRLYSVLPNDWDAFRAAAETQRYEEKYRKPLPGKIVFDETIAAVGAADEMTETRIDLSAALANGVGQVILSVEPAQKPEKKDYYYENENAPVLKWIQATNIGLDAFADNENLVSFATDLKNGKPLAGAQIFIFGGASAATDENGLANLNLPQSSKFHSLLVAKNGDDTAILPENTEFWRRDEWYKKPYYSYERWYVFDDRGMYRPNEEVSVKGYVRRVTAGKFSDIAELGETDRTVFYKVKDARRNEIFKGQTKLNAFGAFDFKFKLPDNLNLGNAFVELGFSDNASDTSHNFQVQEFRRPEFEVSVKAETTAPYFVGDSVTLESEAKYYSGGFLANAPVNWTIYAQQTNYTPPNRDDFTFGTFAPWWIRSYDGEYRNYSYAGYAPPTAQNFSGETDANGKHRLAVDFTAANPARPYTLTAGASVQDVNRQTLAGSTNLLVHPSTLYVGLRTSKSFVRRGESFKVETITTDLDGRAAANRDVEIKAVLKDWRSIENSWREIVIDTQTCQIKSTETAAACDLTAKEGGVFTITATVRDDRERPNESEITLWVAGAQTPPKRTIEKESAMLIPDKKEYAPNDTAEILVSAPFVPAEGVLTLRRNGIVKTERFTMNESSTVLQIPIDEKYLPNITAQVDLVGASDRTDDKGEIDKSLPKRPAFASGDLNLKISTASRKLNVAAEPLEKTLEPGGQTNVNVEVTDNSGAPVAGAEIALVAVDEGVLALSNYSIRNPLEYFYSDINAGVTDHHSRQSVLLGNPNDAKITTRQIENFALDGREISLLQTTVNVTSKERGEFAVRKSDKENVYKDWAKKDAAYIITDKKNQPIKIRQNFNALATFAPSVVTNANGKAVVSVKLPDNLTRYRITAIAVTKSKQFGKAESNVTAKKSLQARPSAPRFMNFGDRIELPVVLQNQTDKPLTIDVAVRASNAVLTNGSGKKITVPANDRAEVRFPAITQRAGTARFQIGAAAGNLTDAAQIEIPVWTPATTEAFATYGTTVQSGAIVQPVQMPKDVFVEFGGLEITTSSTQLQELTDGFSYLINYPFGCTEQISSKILAIAAFRDVLTAFETKDLPSKPEIEEIMRQSIQRLQQLQHYDGGFSFWRSDDESIPFISVHAAHALARADMKGYAVPPEMIEKAKNYLKGIKGKLPQNYSEESKWAIRAYALYTLNLLKENNANEARNLIREATLEKLSPESVGWILSVLIDDKANADSVAQIEIIKRHLLNRVTETAGAAHFVSKYKDGEYVLLASNRRADGVVLEALLKTEQAASESNAFGDLIPKIVRGLLANRTKGRWQNTQENIFILLALDKYFHVFENAAPNFVTKLWFGNAFAGQQNFKGRSTDTNLVSVPMNYLQKQTGAANVILDKQGAGRLYYRIGMNYAPKNLKLKAADYGFAVTRRYEAVDNPEDVKQNSDGNWTIKAGARVRVELQMIAPTRRYHVALVDKLPAGFEIINSALATSEIVPRETIDNRKLNRRYWFEHQNLRDERAEAFTSLLWEGVWNYVYVARATTPGTFVVPPAKAEEMYAPETFGRSNTDLVQVE